MELPGIELPRAEFIPAVSIFLSGADRSSGCEAVGCRATGIAQRHSPPMQARQHGGHGTARPLGLQEHSSPVELFPCTGKADGVAHGDRVQLGKHEAQLLDRAKAAGYATVGNESNRFGVPLGAD